MKSVWLFILCAVLAGAATAQTPVDAEVEGVDSTTLPEGELVTTPSADTTMDEEAADMESTAETMADAPSEPLYPELEKQTVWHMWKAHTKDFFSTTLPGAWSSLKMKTADYEFGDIDVGWRIRKYQFYETRKGNPGGNDTYFGSIYRITEDQSYFPGVLYLQYRVNPYWGLGLSYDSIDAETIDIANRGTPEASQSGDGNVELSGPLFYAFGRYPNETPFTPFAELGMALYSSDFAAKETWSRNGQNRLEVDDATGWFLTGGCDYSFPNHWSVEAFMRHTVVSADAVWYLQGAPRDSDVTFDLGNLAFGLGAKYTF